MDKKGKILIPGISEAVAPVTEEELELYDKIDFDLEEYTRDVGARTLLHDCKVPPTCQARTARSPGAPGRGLQAGQTRAYPGHVSARCCRCQRARRPRLGAGSSLTCQGPPVTPRGPGRLQRGSFSWFAHAGKWPICPGMSHCFPESQVPRWRLTAQNVYLPVGRIRSGYKFQL